MDYDLEDIEDLDEPEIDENEDYNPYDDADDIDVELSIKCTINSKFYEELEDTVRNHIEKLIDLDLYPEVHSFYDARINKI